MKTDEVRSPGSRGVEAERMLLTLRPSAWLIARRTIVVWVMISVLTTLAVMALRRNHLYDAARWSVFAGEALCIMKLAAEVLLWTSTRYVLTTRRMVSARGVLRRAIIEAPLENIQHTVILKGLFERGLGLGTLGAATAGTEGIGIVWLYLRDPGGVSETVRLACDAARGRGRGSAREVEVEADSAMGRAGAPDREGPAPADGSQPGPLSGEVRA